MRLRNSFIYLVIISISGYFILHHLPDDNLSLTTLLLISVVSQYSLLSIFSGSTVGGRIILSLSFCFIGYALGVFAVAYVAFNRTHALIETSAAFVFPGTIISLHLLWKSIKKLGKKMLDPHNQGIQ